MAYKTAELEKQALKVIKEKNLYFIEDVVSYLPCGKTTFYERKLNEANSLKEALEENKINTKVGLRKKWYESDNATVQIALYKLISTDEENDRINSQKSTIDHLNNGQSFNSLSDVELITRVNQILATRKTG
jgi:hypothetical protein